MSIEVYRPRFISKAPRGRNYIPKRLRSEIYERDNNTCQYCHRTFPVEKLTIEHIIPVSKGGIDDVINYITVCRSCNSSKKDKPLVEFIKDKWNIKISELPIHGDIIMDTPELDSEYRRVRQFVYYKMRKNNSLKGGSALKKLEKAFRSHLWRTKYGEILSKRYPELPGQVRASIPLVDYLVPDTRKPVHRLLVEFCKSAPTRALIDDMVRLLSNSMSRGSDQVIKAVIYGDHDEATLKRIDQAFKRARLVRGGQSIFSVPQELQEVPLAERDLLQIKVIGEKDKFGIAKFDDFEIHIPGARIGEELEILITKCYSNYAEADIARLPSPYND